MSHWTQRKKELFIYIEIYIHRYIYACFGPSRIGWIALFVECKFLYIGTFGRE